MKMLLLWFWAIFNLSSDTNFVVGEDHRTNLIAPVKENPIVLRFSPLWLRDLENSYEFGFAKQFGHRLYRNDSGVPNHNSPWVAENKCQNVSIMSFDQNRRLIHHFGYESTLNSTIQDMLNNPRARLFQFEDHWGEVEDYRFLRSSRSGMCSDLFKLTRRVKSVFPFGKCIRLFEKKDCVGWSLAVYPGSSNSHRLEVPRHVTFQSIGPCLENEFSGGGYLNQSIPGFVTKNPELRSFQPDLVLIFNPDINLGRSKVFGGVGIQYSLGPGNRTENIEIRLKSWINFALHPKASVEDERDFDKSLEKEDGDVLGHGIPTTIGGPANEGFNIFSGNPSTFNTWENVVLPSSRNIKDIRMLNLQFEYESRNETRPIFFYYWIWLKEDDERFYQIKYGRIINAHRTNRRRDKSYIQEIPKFQYKGFRQINLSEVIERRRGISKLMGSLLSDPSLKNINRRTQNPVIKSQSFKIPNLKHDTEIEENITQLYLSTAQIQGMVKNPMVRLFPGENLTGDSVEYHSGRQNIYFKGCSYTRPLAVVKSAETFGKCIRLFEDFRCEGVSLAIYGRSPTSHQPINKILKSVRSVGPCLEDEFINAGFMDKIGGQVAKDRNSSSYFPDLVVFRGTEFHHELWFRRSGFRDIFYGVGHKNRIEHIRTEIYQVGPAEIPKTVEENTEYYKSLDKKEGDVPCYAIPLKFSGPANESLNIFPISQSKVDDWVGIFPSFSSPNEELLFSVELRFVYEHVKSTRPQFVYYFVYSNSDKEINYGRFNNL